jgi:hypothetical protein
MDRSPAAGVVRREHEMAETRSRLQVSTIAVPALLVVVIALAALSYVASRASITRGPMYAVPGVQATGSSFTVKWQTGTDVAIIASFTPSRAVRVRSITLTGMDPKVAFIATSEYGFWDGRTSLPSFSAETDPLPLSFQPRPIHGSFAAPAHSNVFVRLVVRAISAAEVASVITGIRVDAESWSWAHTTYVPFQEPVRLVPPR